MPIAYFAPCPRGLEQALADELAEIAIRPEVDELAAFEVGRTVPGGVHFFGTQGAAYAVNLHSRIASRVLMRLGARGYRSEDDIYSLTAAQRWEDHFSPDETIRVDVTAHKSPLQSLNFVALRVKDGICDRFRQRAGARPSVDTVSPDVRIYAYLSETDCTLYLDTTGEPLFKRGWRQEKGEAPLKENLAAGILRLTGWTGAQGQPFYDPMCGSGTFLVEAAQRALGVAPGGQRAFACEWMRDHDAKRFKRLREAAADAAGAAMHHRPPLIAGADISTDMLAYAAANWRRAGLPGEPVLKQVDARFGKPPFEAPGVLLMNPPYGERIVVRGAHGSRRRGPEGETGDQDGTVFERASRAMGAGRDDPRRPSRELRQPEPAPVIDPREEAAANEFAQAFAGTLKREFAGWQAFVFTGDLSMPRRMRLKESQRTPLYNGNIECRLFRFEMVKGGMRDRPAGESAPSPDSGSADAS
ncbi:THUMP domain-containing class I SAM-dependent RNA methyltransferase [Ralstonia pseudosolanacearum]|uniref:THUMP domain-containing class I SAM-dependent RNA methyltransferase n=1 Tax=Ralstonia pseudosolanacearum TaxID=1310165 RepID=UPI0026767033|nr:class I SAM-dependent RNA methyltransferase [Ralstonia pseudosolanacearum]MDO3562002.1 class I SAM-dependent RNA methyltransferase [Ralstonia pseudosolanacearum]MDO3569787.1 class I SAM-dependent RNA methyltransferase [Ralstonia pseudosolanacearum]